MLPALEALPSLTKQLSVRNPLSLRWMCPRQYRPQYRLWQYPFGNTCLFLFAPDEDPRNRLEPPFPTTRPWLRLSRTCMAGLPKKRGGVVTLIPFRKVTPTFPNDPMRPILQRFASTHGDHLMRSVGASTPVPVSALPRVTTYQIGRAHV